MNELSHNIIRPFARLWYKFLRTMSYNWYGRATVLCLAKTKIRIMDYAKFGISVLFVVGMSYLAYLIYQDLPRYMEIFSRIVKTK